MAKIHYESGGNVKVPVVLMTAYATVAQADASVQEIVVEVPIAPPSIMVPIRPQAVPVMGESERGPAALRLALAPTRA